MTRLELGQALEIRGIAGKGVTKLCSQDELDIYCRMIPDCPVLDEIAADT